MHSRPTARPEAFTRSPFGPSGSAKSTGGKLQVPSPAVVAPVLASSQPKRIVPEAFAVRLFYIKSYLSAEAVAETFGSEGEFEELSRYCWSLDDASSEADGDARLRDAVARDCPEAA